ncbi:MAG TPA: hypothetical protein VGR62_01535 [Candidatus Binatia bacterium]|nr:hypothetical protein [Candidatus Binatia bacterium]
MGPLVATAPAQALPIARRRAVTLGALLGLLVLAAVAIETPRYVSWYLAVDQFGYLTLASDLAHGRFFHAWGPIDALAGVLTAPVDVLVQTWVFDGARLYSRYAPGYPLLLAAAMRLFGMHGAIYLNVVVLMGLLGVLLLLGRRLLGDSILAVIATALVLVCPTWVAMWARSPLRDLPAHLAALTGVALAIWAADTQPPGRTRWVLAGGALGYAVTIRPDAVLWLPAAALAVGVVWWQRGRPSTGIARPLAAAALGGLLGLAPLLAYNTAVSGNPLRAVQSVEARDFFDADATPDRSGGPYRGTTAEAVSGGGLRLGNLPVTLPANLQALRRAWGDVLLLLALAGAVVTMRTRPLLAVVTVPYAILGLLFFSCWVHADPRYLAGVMLVMALLAAAGLRAALGGLADLVTRAGRIAALPLAALLAAVLAWPQAAGGMLWGDAPGAPRLLVAIVLVGAALWSLTPAHWRRGTLDGGLITALAMTLTVLLLGRALVWTGEPALFQEETMLHARRTLAAAIEPGGVVISVEDIGRPVENIEYWSDGTHALYLTDLARWHLSIADVARAMAGAGRATYLLLPPHPTVDALVRGLDTEGVHVDLVRAIAPTDALGWFVGARGHRGVPLNLYRLRPA